MKFLEHKEIDLKKWDEVILNSEMPLVFAQAFYLNATSPDWGALVSDDYKSVMPVTANKKMGISYLMQPPFTPQLGIFGSFDADTANNFLTYLKNKFKYISIELNASNTIIPLETKSKRTFVINYGKPYSYNSNSKRNIIKAKKSDLKFGIVPEKEIMEVNTKYLHPFLNKKLKIEPKHIKLFDQLLLNSIKKKYLKTFTVSNSQGEVKAIAHFISNGKHVLYLKGTNFDKSSNTGSMHLLMDHAIEYYKEKKAGMFDFGGGQSDSLAQFFSGFGAAPLTYKVFFVNNLPLAIKWLKE